jgi:membrane fusion protein (multidrug efflux system)
MLTSLHSFTKHKAVSQLSVDRSRTAAASREQYDQRQTELTTANANVAEALAEVYQIRVSLGLPAQPDQGQSLGQVPPDLDQTFSSILQAQAGLIESAAKLGVIHSYDQSPKQMIEEFEKLGDIDRVFSQLTAKAPAVKQAEAKLESAISPRPNWTFSIALSWRRSTVSSRVGTSIRAIMSKSARI